MHARWWMFVGSVLYLCVVAILDFYVLPDVSLPILYAAPVLILSFTELILIVAAAAAVATLLMVASFLASVLISQEPMGWWPFALASFLAICFIAILAAGQRAFIRRNCEEAARVRWNQLLLSEVAHELRTPLTVILGYTQLLLQNPNLSSRYVPAVEAIERSALRMRDSVDDLAQRWKRGREDAT